MSGQGEPKYVTCIRCAYVMTWIQHDQLRCSMSCPVCDAEDQFGPGIYVPDFTGYTMGEVQQQKASKTRRTSCPT